MLRNIRLGATIDGLVRKESYELPLESIREMIINAHCHRNLIDDSCVQVAIYDDRLEVSSPGGLYNGLTYEEIMNGHSFREWTALWMDILGIRQDTGKKEILQIMKERI